MQINEKEMNLEDVEKELTLAKYEYRDICDIDFTPVNARFYYYMVFVTGGIFLGGISVLLASDLPLLYQITGCMILSFLLTTLYGLYPNTRRKFYLSNFPTKDLVAIKSDQFLLAEFRKHLIDNNTAVSAEFSKIAENYRKELKNKIERLSNLKESLERENLIKSMQ